jgi:hypothetical protein
VDSVKRGRVGGVVKYPVYKLPKNKFLCRVKEVTLPDAIF